MRRDTSLSAIGADAPHSRRRPPSRSLVSMRTHVCLIALCLTLAAGCNAVTDLGPRQFGTDLPDGGSEADADAPSDTAVDSCVRNACGGCGSLVAAPGDPCCG